MLHTVENQYGRRELEIEDKEEPIIFEKLKPSDYINFIERNDILTAYQIQFFRSQIELNELSVRQISKF